MRTCNQCHNQRCACKPKARPAQIGPTGAAGATGGVGPTGPCCTGPTGPTGPGASAAEGEDSVLFPFAGTLLPEQPLPAYFANDGLDSPVSDVLLGDAGPYPAYPMTRRTVIDRLFVNVQAQDFAAPPASQFQLLKNGIPIGEPVVFPTSGTGEDEAVLQPGSNRSGVIFEPVTFEPFDTLSLMIFGQPFNTTVPLRVSAMAGSPAVLAVGSVVPAGGFIPVFDAPGGNVIGGLTLCGGDTEVLVLQEFPGFVQIAANVMVSGFSEAFLRSEDIVILAPGTLGFFCLPTVTV